MTHHCHARGSGRAIQHSAESVEHYGPEYMGGMVRTVFACGINLDPASCAQANMLIGAERYYTEQDDGLTKPWSGTVYLNPPGGRIRYEGAKVNSAALWYATLAHRYAMGLVTQAVFMVFNLELLRYAQLYKVRQPLDFSVCVPRGRIDFYKPGKGTPGEMTFPIPQGAPAHPSMLVYMGPHVDRFRNVFEPETGKWPGGLVRGDPLAYY